MKLTAHLKRRTVQRLERQLAAARAAYQAALEADAEEMDRRRTLRERRAVRGRNRVILRGERRRRRAHWHERAALRIAHPMIG